jgi:D-serine deaminase-like pyridoxal phosphate-dependent protein
MSASPAYAVARGMIGESGSRYRIPTPALIVDEGLLDANIAAMAQRVRNKAALRPHAKIHKCAWIAHKQIAEGAVGILRETRRSRSTFASRIAWHPADFAGSRRHRAAATV